MHRETRPVGRIAGGEFTPIGVLAIALWLAAPAQASTARFVRGDANSDSRVDIGDAIYLLGFNFHGGAPPRCLDAADSNDDGRLDISDAIFLLTFLFNGSSPPPEPYPAAGPDTTIDLIGCSDPQLTPGVLRHGTFVEREHGVNGCAEHLERGAIRLTGFFYDGGGPPGVFVWLHRDRTTESQGFAISPDLSGQPLENATLEFDIPPEISGDDFDYVSIWCVVFDLNYGFARLVR